MEGEKTSFFYNVSSLWQEASLLVCSCSAYYKKDPIWLRPQDGIIISQNSPLFCQKNDIHLINIFLNNKLEIKICLKNKKVFGKEN